MATQTQTQRKAAAQKGAATRRRKAAQRKRSAQKAAETRARAQENTLKSLAYKGQDIGQRAVDVTVGAAAEARDRVAGAVRPVRNRTERNRLTGRVRSSVRDAQRRGARVRKDAQRTVRTRRRDTERRVTRARREAERHVTKARRDAERRVKSLRS